MQLDYAGSVAMLTRAEDSSVDVCCTDDFSAMTGDIATKNLNLLAAFKKPNLLEINPKDFRELIFATSQEKDDCAWPVADRIARIIEVSFDFEKNKRETPDLPTSLEEQALEGLNRAIDAQGECKESVRELKAVAENLKNNWPRRLPEETSSQRLSFRKEVNQVPQKEVEAVRHVNNSSSWPPANTPGETQASSQQTGSPSVTRENDPVEMMATGAAGFLLAPFGFSGITPGGCFETKAGGE